MGGPLSAIAAARGPAPARGKGGRFTPHALPAWRDATAAGLTQVKAAAAGVRDPAPAPLEPAMDSPISLDIDGALVAREIGLEVAEFRRLMDEGKIAVLCERGTGEDAGRYRASFYYGERRARLVVDSRGRPVSS